MRKQGGIENSQEHEGWGGFKGRRFEGEDEVGALHCREGASWIKLNSGGIQAGGARGGRRSVSRCETFRRSRDAARRTVSGVIAT